MKDESQDATVISLSLLNGDYVLSIKDFRQLYYGDNFGGVTSSLVRAHNDSLRDYRGDRAGAVLMGERGLPFMKWTFDSRLSLTKLQVQTLEGVVEMHNQVVSAENRAQKET
jgi:hypothetical protein